jgi:nuclear pore complex protein Nup93
LHLRDSKEYNSEILIRAARHSEENDRVSEVIKLYNLAGDCSTVVSWSSPDEKAKQLERTASDILRHYERTNRAVGKDRDAVIKLLRIREAVEAKNAGNLEVTLDVSGFDRSIIWSSSCVCVCILTPTHR